MGIARRQSAPDLVTDLEENTKHYSFFRAVKLLLDDVGHDVEERALHDQKPKDLYFLVNPSLGFPTSDLDKLEMMEGEDKNIRLLTTNILGLHGTSSPLPTHLLDSATQSQNANSVQLHFQDFFSNRLTWLFYLIWRKYRYHVRYRPNADDQFSNWMFALIGLEGKASRGKSGVPWAKLLTYLGVISARTRSAELISGVIAHAFDIPKVTIEEWQQRIVRIPKDQQSALGQQNAVLGENAIIGENTRDITGKFTVNLHNLSFTRFQEFLPSGKNYARLKELVEFLLKDQLAFDLQLIVQEKERPNFQLGKQDYCNLGWTTFVGEKRENNTVNLQVKA